ncbi:putative membrane protein [Wigglesworthia glossinidia endosymbiont of Glossina morsitans morsitans (Yale colony)]|uniref:Ancillary SecYEG translocon subunit n=1 Tax=Wigglesworthia glossinidia endosymbiont of Glossina morsitans morsitans (Yale colony) TaxID=1142511 RepID=H6Q4G1_WIGGL|nr:tetratricopeptide repeat protein [Wigglesworthia glossinidia]AFA41021.1 putative membrane protein [Wigglesworthia glossinidia endosymbiont of Glossina morsitans morsitans (Yale colony)]
MSLFKINQYIFKKNIFILLFFFIFILISIFFYKKYQRNKNDELYQSFQIWKDMKKKLENSEYTNFYAAKEHKNNYTVFILLGIAKINVENNKFEEALVYLNKAFLLAEDLNLKSLIALRKARLMLQQNDIENAENILKNITRPGWKELAHYILNHDVHFKKTHKT